MTWDGDDAQPLFDPVMVMFHDEVVRRPAVPGRLAGLVRALDRLAGCPGSVKLVT